MARKKKVTASASSDSADIAKSAFVEHAHLQTVYVNKTTGDFYLHAPHEKKVEQYDVVNRADINFEEVEPAEA